MTGSQSYMESLEEIRNEVMLLSIANAHMCEERYLSKIGQNIDQGVEKLKDDISALKSEFPGKFVKEVDTDDILAKIRASAQAMLTPGVEIQEQCTLGELGKELESNVKSITEAVNLIRGQVEGGGGFDHSGGSAGLRNSVEDTWSSAGAAVTMGLKILVCVILVAALAFCYLFFTMEKESVILKEIAVSEAGIVAQREIISQLDFDKEQVAEEIAVLEKQEPDTEERLKILDLKLKLHTITEDHYKAETEIAIRESEVAEKKKNLDEMGDKSFFTRLLRL